MNATGADSAGLCVSVVIPTHGREVVLCNTIGALLALKPPPFEIVVVDQTPQHEPATQDALEGWAQGGHITWLRRQPPSIPLAMNEGLLASRGEIVLFVDDDVIPDPELVAAHARSWEAAAAAGVGLVAGRVVQPWDNEESAGSAGFSFAQRAPAWVEHFMGGNFSVRRETALRLGGFD